MPEVLADVLPGRSLAVLSGPSFAGEVARGLPTAVTLACPDPGCAESLAEAIATPSFRPYFASDMVGSLTVWQLRMAHRAGRRLFPFQNRLHARQLRRPHALLHQRM